MNETARIIDLIYEAAFVPETWVRVLDIMAAGVSAYGSVLFNSSPATTTAIASASLADLDEKMLDEGWLQRNTRAARLLTIQHQGFVDEAAWFTEEEYNTQPIFTEVMKPLGYGFGTSTFITAPGGDRFIFGVEKKKVQGPVSAAHIAWLDGLRPHLARAALMAGRLEFERNNAALAALQLGGLPSAIIRADGCVSGLNPLLEQLSPQIMVTAGDRLRFGHGPANTIFSAALEQCQTQRSLASRTFPVPQCEDRSPAVVHLVPVEGNARDIFSSAALLVVVTPIDRTRVPGVETIQGLFDLTPAEARVARAIATGRDVPATAGHLSVSTETVRSHVKAILAKSGMARQTDFVAAVASIHPVTK